MTSERYFGRRLTGLEITLCSIIVVLVAAIYLLHELWYLRLEMMAEIYGRIIVNVADIDAEAVMKSHEYCQILLNETQVCQ